MKMTFSQIHSWTRDAFNIADIEVMVIVTTLMPLSKEEKGIAALTAQSVLEVASEKIRSKKDATKQHKSETTQPPCGAS